MVKQQIKHRRLRSVPFPTPHPPPPALSRSHLTFSFDDALSQRRSQDSLLLVRRSSFGENPGNEVSVSFAKSVITTGDVKFYAAST